MKPRLIVVPHSHWDREWYVCYERMRFYLVQFMDRLIEALERDASIPGFLLDGQMILVDDYLEIRPEMEERFRGLAAKGRLTLGPWYVQPDEFLVSGESLVRNLQMGIERAQDFGSPMLEGYVPDTFGHVEQLPQILRGLGIESFYTMRGLGADIDEIGTEFYWEAPDGSRVLTHFLAESYSNAGVLKGTTQESFVHHGKTVSYDNLNELVERMDRRSSAHVLLLLNGSDHTAFQEDVADAVRGLSAELSIRLGLLAEFHKEVEAGGRVSATIRGELRYGRYQPVFKGVFSSRMYLKQLAAEAEERLLVEAERYSTVGGAAGLPPHGEFLSYSWKLLLQNHAHDSICGCSIDAVHEEVVTRLQKSIEVANVVFSEAIERLALLAASRAGIHADGVVPVVVFNPSPWERSGSTRLSVHPLRDSPLGARRFGFSEPRRDFSLDSCTLETLDGQPVPFETESTEVTVEDVLLRRKVLFTDTIRFAAEAVPALGYRVYRLRYPNMETAPSEAPAVESEQKAKAPAEAMSGAARSTGRPFLDNGLVRVTMREDGSIDLHDYASGRSAEGFNLFIDEGDAGDEYTFSSPPVQATLTSKSCTWRIDAVGRRLEARTSLAIPVSLAQDRRSRSSHSVSCEIRTSVELEPGSRLVRFETSFANACADHRLRIVFQTGLRPLESVAETAFGVARRPTQLESTPGDREVASGIFPQRRFVAIESNGNGFALLNKGLPEYEATPEGVVALTLLRAVGWLSRSDLLSRPGQVGPELPTPGAQCPGPHRFEYAVCLFSGPIEEQPLFRIAEEYLHPLQSVAVQTSLRASGDLSFDSFMSIDNPRVVLSALRAEGNGAIMRLFNPLEVVQSFSARWGRRLESVEETQLTEAPGTAIPLSGERDFEASVPPFSIATFRVRFAEPTAARSR